MARTNERFRLSNGYLHRFGAQHGTQSGNDAVSTERVTPILHLQERALMTREDFDSPKKYVGFLDNRKVGGDNP